MTKLFAFVVIAMSFVAAESQAATCRQTVEKAVIQYAANKIELIVDVSSRLVSTNGRVRHYLVEARTDDSDGASSWSWADFYLVTATGTQYSCVVKNIKSR